jgi:hypothetical protein
MEYRSLNKLKFVISQSTPTQVTPSPTGPITLPVIRPYLPGVNLCGSPDANKESCSACDELAGITASLGNISDTVIRDRLRKAKEALGDMCALIGGCSTSQAGNIAPYQDGTACLCSAFMALIASFKGTFNAALLQNQWNDKSRRALTDVLKNQEEIAVRAIRECYRRYRISDNKTSRDKIIEIINTYVG